MLSIAAMGSGQAKYYTNLATEDYYLEGGEPLGKWLGSGARALGLTGTVTKEALHNLLGGYSADGRDALVQNADAENRQEGWDLTFSVPKSVSVLWANADTATRQEIQQAHFQAVKEALAYLEEVAGICRVGKGGRESIKAGLLFAAFEHGTSRAQDPHFA